MVVQSLSFNALIVGDWGALSANLTNVAASMDTRAQATSALAVISTGDNFYSGAGALSYDGIQTADDAKFTQIWANVFNGTYLKTLPWWTVMGNHDWNGAGSATSELEHQGANWVLPDYFYTKRVQVDTGVYASFIFIETDLLYYNFTGYTTAMATQFTALGWNAESNTVAKQLSWIENAIAAANNDAYIFVVGHHPIYTCQGNAQTKFMPTLLSYINKWNVSGYMNGHEHSLAGYLTNNGSTLQIQSGSGGKLDKACAPLDQTFTAGNETLSYGFAHLRIDATKATVDWINESGTTVLSLSVNARVPAVGLTAQPVLANSTDAAIHYTKPKAVDYLIIGDWGALSANLSNVATTMNTWAESTSSQAVISTGDNFYSGAGALSYDGIQTADDAKFTQIWANVFNGTYLKTLPWWTVMGNHDWNGAGSATSELEHQGANWVLPDYFYTKRIEVDTGVYASFIFIETDLLYYNFTGYTAAMAAQFTAVGWNAESNTVAKQLAWIENAIAAANNDAYIFVVGHHPIYTCQGNAQTKFMPTLLSYINKWNVSGYMNGHEHSLAGYLTNNGSTLQIQSGSGGKLDKACAPLDQTFTAGNETLSYGFAHLRLTKTKATVDWVSETGSTVLTLSVKARVPAVGLTAQPVLANSTDFAIHYTKPTCNPVSPPSPLNRCKNVAAPSGLAALAAAGPVNATTPTPFTGTNGTSLAASLAATFPSSLGPVDPALVAASLQSANVSLTPGQVTQVLGGNLPSSPSGLAAVFVTLTSTTYTFGPATNNATYGVESPFNITSTPITNGTEITFPVPTFVGSIWYAFNLTASLNLIVSINANTSVLGTVSYQLTAIGGPTKRQSGINIQFTQGTAGVGANAAGSTCSTTTTTTCTATATASATASGSAAAASCTTTTGAAAGNSPSNTYGAPAGSTPSASAGSAPYAPVPAGNTPATTTKASNNLVANSADKLIGSAAVAAAVALLL